jgi:hypothetical protein
MINALYEEGNTIIIYTSRFMGRNKNDIIKTHKEGYEFTLKQLASWGVKFHELIMGKPRYDLLVDDRAIFYKKNWKQISEEINEKLKC